MKQLYFALCMLLVVSFTACRDSEFDNPVDNGGENGMTDKNPLTVFDDLEFFQNAVIPVDSTGTMLYRRYGVLLRDAEPEHLYIGVKDLTEAETLFRNWIAPDVALSTTIPTTNGLTCPLTDMDGKPQGTIYFTPANDSRIVAEVTASSDTQLKYFNCITFMYNKAIGFQTSIYRKYTEGDIITHAPTGKYTEYLYPEDKVLNWVCIRQSSTGQKPIFCAITNAKYTCPNGSGEDPYHHEYYPSKRTSYVEMTEYCPDLSFATTISNILQTSWDVYCDAFDRAGCGSLRENKGKWINYSHWVFTEYMYYSSGKTYGAGFEDMWNQFLLKLDWLDDDDINTGIVATAGSPGLINDRNEDYPNLFDGSFNNKYCSTTGRRTDGVWFVEFQTNAPLIPNGYKMTTANDCSKYKGRNPKSWKLYGKGNRDDEWTLLSEVQDGRMADIDCRTYTYPINKVKKSEKEEATYGYYMYYRLEISSSVDSNVLMLSEFNLTFQNTIDKDHAITTTAGTQRDDGQDSYNNLFNSDTKYYWYCPSKFKQNDLWFVEFETAKPGTAVSYNLYTSSLSSNDYRRHPKDWKLYGKLNQTDEWTLIDEQTGQDLPHKFYTAKNYVISNPAEYQYYRFEVSAVNGDDKLILGGFEFVYDD